MDYNYSDSVLLIITWKSLKHQLRMRSEDYQKVEDLKYQLDDAVAKERQTQNIIKSPREQSLSVRSGVGKYRQRLPLYIERFTENFTDRFKGSCTVCVRRTESQWRNSVQKLERLLRQS